MSGSETWDDAAIIALGSNLRGAYPSREALLEAAVEQLAREVGQIRVRSSWWENPAWPEGSGPSFLNGVAILETAFGPLPMLERLHAIERAFGRERAQPNAPRTLDLDLIAHGRRIDALGPPLLPHPRATRRPFVMGPLAEIAPAWRHPESGITARELAAALVDPAIQKPKR